MKKTCSIRLLFGTILITAVLAGCMGYFAGAVPKWKVCEKRIVLLEKKISEMEEKSVTASRLKESLNPAEPYAYLLKEERGYVAVYRADGKTLYATTDIRVQELPEALQEELEAGKYVGSEEQLYSFLENYSS